jgi:hypothetical protein
VARLVSAYEPPHHSTSWPSHRCQWKATANRNRPRCQLAASARPNPSPWSREEASPTNASEASMVRSPEDVAAALPTPLDQAEVHIKPAAIIVLPGAFNSGHEHFRTGSGPDPHSTRAGPDNSGRCRHERPGCILFPKWCFHPNEMKGSPSGSQWHAYCSPTCNRAHNKVLSARSPIGGGRGGSLSGDPANGCATMCYFEGLLCQYSERVSCPNESRGLPLQPTGVGRRGDALSQNLGSR